MNAGSVQTGPANLCSFSHQTFSLPLRSPACWVSCAGGRELEREAGGRQPGVRSMCEQSAKPVPVGEDLCVC